MSVWQSTAQRVRVRQSGIASDQDAFVARFEHETMPLLGRLYAAATQLTSDRSAAGNLVQETYLRAFEAFRSNAATMSGDTWLFRLLADTAPEASIEQPPPHPAPAHQPLPLKSLERLSDREVKAALRQLPRSTAIVVHLSDVEDFSLQQIADIMHLPLPTVASRLRLGRRRLVFLPRMAASAATKRSAERPSPV
ncbi:sigma factor-like helix-turn-helix DNA-binding protein [Streptomyces cadmiisoli]|uniref:sigma factor-like helix-turn-helix DNA-binding protein n=1 Tax=Streptomyces cadmiisoli TaxID=2184053 RepID=UPI003D7301AB